MQPVVTDAYGRAEYYAAQGIYTCLYWSPQIAGLQVVLVDQAIVPPDNTLAPAFNQDSSAMALSLVPLTVLTKPLPYRLLRSSQMAFSWLWSMGIVQIAFAFEGTLIVLETAPNPGSTVSAIYEIVAST
jgi:hypothetical protein